MFISSNRKVFIGLVLCPVLLTGCATQGGTDQITGAGTGAVIGAGAGYGLCILLGGNPADCVIKGAIPGVVAGAAAGWSAVKFSQYHSEQVRTAQDDQRLRGLTKPVDSPQVKILKGTSTPYMVKPGETVKVTTDYSVTLPPNMQTTPVTESWVLTQNGKPLANIPN